MPEDAPWTVGRLLQWTTGFLQQHGADSPRLDAEVLLAEAMRCQRIELYTAFSEEPDEATRNRFRELVRRRAEGAPVAYLVGYREFYSLRFRVTPDVLIPRPETELLVVTLLDLAKELAGERIGICDVGTGSGIVAISAAKHLPDADVLALDLSEAALEVARGNAREHGVDDRVAFVQSDVMAAVPLERQFDFIVSNPPYVRQEEMESLPRTVKDYEPRGALLAGERGTEVIERLIPQAANHLVSGGWLLVEVSPMIHEAACGVIAAEPCFELGPTVKDLARLPRVVQARRRESAPAQSQ